MVLVDSLFKHLSVNNVYYEAVMVRGVVRWHVCAKCSCSVGRWKDQLPLLQWGARSGECRPPIRPHCNSLSLSLEVTWPHRILAGLGTDQS